MSDLLAEQKLHCVWSLKSAKNWVSIWNCFRKQVTFRLSHPSLCNWSFCPGNLTTLVFLAFKIMSVGGCLCKIWANKVFFLPSHLMTVAGWTSHCWCQHAPLLPPLPLKDARCSWRKLTWITYLWGNAFPMAMTAVWKSSSCVLGRMFPFLWRS